MVSKTSLSLKAEINKTYKSTMTFTHLFRNKTNL